LRKYFRKAEFVKDNEEMNEKNVNYFKNEKNKNKKINK
jgi:hypothetical protein